MAWAAWLQTTLILAAGLMLCRVLVRRNPAQVSTLGLVFLMSSGVAFFASFTEVSWRPSWSWYDFRVAESTAVQDAMMLGGGVVIEPHADVQTAKNTEAQALVAQSPSLLHHWKAVICIFWALGVLGLMAHWLWQLWLQHQEYLRAKVDKALTEKFGVLSRYRMQAAWSETAQSAYLWLGDRPRIVLPQKYQDESDDRLRMVILHELAHHARGDNVRYSLLRLARNLLWFHPFAWWLEQQSRASAELAADQEVIERGIDPCEYGDMLVSFCRTYGLSKPKGNIAGLLGFSLTQRVQSLLHPPQPIDGWFGRGIKLISFGLATVLAVYEIQLPMQPRDAWLRTWQQNLTPRRFQTLPSGTLQLVLVYDGDDATQSTQVSLELEDINGLKRWVTFPPLKKFTSHIARHEMVLAQGVTPTRRIKVDGVVADGVIDGVAVGVAYRRDDRSEAVITQSASQISQPMPVRVCAWPLALEVHRFEDFEKLPHWQVDSIKRLICGAQLVHNGTHTLQ